MKLESGKFEAQKRMYELVRTQKLQPQMDEIFTAISAIKVQSYFRHDFHFQEKFIEFHILNLN